MASNIMPRAPLPLKGFMNAVGKPPTKSLFMPSCSTIHRMPPMSISMAPDALKTPTATNMATRSEEHTSELQSRQYLVCRLLLEKKKKTTKTHPHQHIHLSNSTPTHLTPRPSTAHHPRTRTPKLAPVYAPSQHDHLTSQVHIRHS